MHGEILSIPQPLTTLRRPTVGRPQLVSHDDDDEHANLIWIRFNEALRSGNVPVREGRFGARTTDRPITPLSCTIRKATTSRPCSTECRTRLRT
ncbi:hypothetical protein KSY61_02840 [Bifidobacterium sp. MSK.13.7]|nr:hypothetical protein [Bifidobacterium pseudocatenulatum]MBV4125957.1 hypothetical protein [Bifidobacterium pseudocatenulatum]MBV4140104.1 hypothetical protein [Bifidobacterium sp. MSK.13.7]MBV4144934.1 hypothetical protein [Bifidobacterium sp. MSK.13.1]